MLKKGFFSLIELLIVISILLALMTMLLPALKRTQYNAQVLICKNNLSQVGVAYALYGHDYGKYPTPISPGHWLFGGLGRRDAAPGQPKLPPGVGRPSAVAVLYLEGYDLDPEVFYCPLAEFFTHEKFWHRHKTSWIGVFTGYSWVAGWQRKGGIPENIRNEFAQDPYSEPSTVIATDNTVGNRDTQSWNWTSHQLGSLPRDGNILHNDGSVALKNYEEMKYKFTTRFGFYW